MAAPSPFPDWRDGDGFVETVDVTQGGEQVGGGLGKVTGLRQVDVACRAVSEPDIGLAIIRRLCIQTHRRVGA